MNLKAIIFVTVLVVFCSEAKAQHISRPGDYLRRIENNPLYAEYVFRLRERRIYALEARRAYNANRGPHIYRIPSVPMYPQQQMNWGPLGAPAIQRGWIQQPSYFYYRRPVIIGF